MISPIVELCCECYQRLNFVEGENRKSAILINLDWKSTDLPAHNYSTHNALRRRNRCHYDNCSRCYFLREVSGSVISNFHACPNSRCSREGQRRGRNIQYYHSTMIYGLCCKCETFDAVMSSTDCQDSSWCMNRRWNYKCRCCCSLNLLFS